MTQHPVQELCPGQRCASPTRGRADLAQGNPSTSRRAVCRVLGWLVVSCGAQGLRAEPRASARTSAAASSPSSVQACPGQGGAGVDPFPGPWHVVAPDVWMLPVREPAPVEVTPAEPGHRHTLVAVRRRDRVWLVGSGPTPAFADAAACGLAQGLAGQRVTDVVNVLAQPEAVMGNAAFDGARLWALESVARDMRRRCPDCLGRLRERLGERAGASLVPSAIRWPRDLLRGRHGRLGPFRWWALQRGQAAQTLLLQHEASGLWLADGWVWGTGLPDLRDADAGRMSRRMGHLATRIAEASGSQARLLGGQGGVTGLHALDRHRNYLDALESAVRRALVAGEPEGRAVDEAAARMPAAHSAAVAAQPGLHQLNWQRMWRALEDEVLR